MESKLRLLPVIAFNWEHCLSQLCTYTHLHLTYRTGCYTYDWQCTWVAFVQYSNWYFVVNMPLNLYKTVVYVYICIYMSKHLYLKYLLIFFKWKCMLLKIIDTYDTVILFSDNDFFNVLIAKLLRKSTTTREHEPLK